MDLAEMQRQLAQTREALEDLRSACAAASGIAPALRTDHEREAVHSWRLHQEKELLLLRLLDKEICQEPRRMPSTRTGIWVKIPMDHKAKANKHINEHELSALTTAPPPAADDTDAPDVNSSLLSKDTRGMFNMKFIPVSGGAVSGRVLNSLVGVWMFPCSAFVLDGQQLVWDPSQPDQQVQFDMEQLGARGTHPSNAVVLYGEGFILSMLDKAQEWLASASAWTSDIPSFQKHKNE